MKHDLFISYSRRNFDEVNSFIELLKSRIPALDIWFDIDGIESGDEFEDKIISAIDNSAYILFALSDAALESQWTKDEVMYAKNTDKKVIPLLLKGATMKGWFLFKFGMVDCIDITNELQVDKLVNNLSSWTGKQKCSDTIKTVPVSTIQPTSTETLDSRELCRKGDDFYYGKNGVSKDYAEAVKWYKKSAELGYAYAQYSVGYCYENGQGVSQDFAEAVKWYRKAAEQGEATAQGNLGYCYDKGQGVSQDYTEAVKWYTKAAEQGNARAQCNLGYCYDKGQGVSQDYTEAVKWYTKAAEQGSAPAQCNLGYCYYIGQGVSQDYAEAVKWYTKAAEQGNARAQCNLGYCYKYGRGVFKDMSLAKYWFQKAADKGHLESKEALELIYHFENVEIYKKGIDYYKQSNYTEAVKYFRQAAEIGVTDAQNYLGYCYERGKGVEMDYSEAIKWYRKAAEQGNTSGMYNLGTCYQEGNGVSKDLSIAKYWYQKAADKGHSISYKKLGEIIMLEKQELRGY